jgi:MFS family permease
LTQAKSTPLTSRQWGVLILLVASVCINYVDRGNLGVAAPLLSGELHLTPDGMGKLLSAFFLTYTAFQIVSGWLVDRFHVSLVFGAGFLLWSAATIATGFAGGFASLFTMRLLLGISESVAYPSYSKIMALSYSEDQRGLANSLIDAGCKIGPAIGTLLGGLLMARYGWRLFFIATGLGSLVWLVPWAIWAPRQTVHPTAVRADSPGVAEILRRRSAWGTFLGLFFGNYVWYLLLTWLPSYFVMERHLTVRSMAVVGSVPFWGIAISSVMGGCLSDHWIRRGGEPVKVRKTFAVAGLLMATLMLPAVMTHNLGLSVALMVLACLSFGFYTSNMWALTQTIAGPAAAGKWTGLQNACGGVAGIVAPWLTGIMVSRTGSFHLAFLAASICCVAGAASYFFLIGNEARFAEKTARRYGVT